MIRRFFQHLRQRFRSKRYQIIKSKMKLDEVSGLILDLGGGPASFFSEQYQTPQNVILVEIMPDAAYLAKAKIKNLNVIIADAENLPIVTKGIALTVCNSVIEHVEKPERLAIETQRVSQSYFLQTPNGRFPLETHSLIAIPFFNWLPGQLAKRMACRIFKGDFDYITSVLYVSEERLRNLFPKATISFERFLFFKKSFYVYQSD